MGIFNTIERWGIVAKTFHWTIAILIVSMIGVGLWMADLPISMQKLQVYFWHKSFGILVLFLASARLLWQLTNPRPYASELQRFCPPY